jgi:hypothetical protein
MSTRSRSWAGGGSKKLTLIPFYHEDRDEASDNPDKPVALIPLGEALPARVELMDGAAIFIDGMRFDTGGGFVAWRPASLTDGLLDFKLCDATGNSIGLNSYADDSYDYATCAEIDRWEWMSEFKDGVAQAVDEATIAKGTHLGVFLSRERLVPLPDQAIEIRIPVE